MRTVQRRGVCTFIRLRYLFFSGAHDFQLQTAQAQAQTKAMSMSLQSQRFTFSTS
ncbi:MAG: hypothetical protein LC109_06250 [Bacteroidia bacterium]|nr:hypothetical protein [Bacteroidia bacterium]MCO5253397.1 hypothetical protein [Bacteroidota bacterium]MCZ2129853.1 hypothetical protein [Bacteroidia bacterium]